MKNRNILSYCLILLASCTVLTSCGNNGDAGDKKNAVARVNNNYLQKEELNSIVPLGATQKDSLAIVTRFIDKWASKRLLLDAAEFNLSDDKVEEIDKLVAQFKSDLLIKAYLEKLVQQQIDTVVKEKDLEAYYNKYKQNFLIDDMLVKLSYVNVMNDNSNFKTIKKYFTSSKKEDLTKLEDMSLHMKSYALNDSIWVDVKQIYEKLPFIERGNRDSYLKNNYFFEEDGENSTYFVKVKSVIGRGKVIPYDFMKKSLRLMVINDRKMELLKQFEEDILKDAKNNKRYEVF
ncbi:hypothetical protein [Myroides phaeus]|uniref:SurA N-terminal domain-containing protein n=1 Tax=Myroides phaeus TaxID=702745 RepID=A0A1G8DIZ5_9FLAO|nr:hypothetical protein [Myroides phaeus]SDH57449.1 hypothetical protein SAMN05421818_10735 [Myroides phaeus]